MLLSALLYYRSVKIQRFLEPALALSQPRNEFTKSINAAFQKGFGAKPPAGIGVKGSSILVERALLFSDDGELGATAPDVLKKLSRVFLSLLKDDPTRSSMSVVLIVAQFSSEGRGGAPYVAERMRTQRMLGFIQDALFHVEPELGKKYAGYFMAGAQPAITRE
ncbi:MAG TPA: hypothetical protein VF903_05845, partial [Nitrospirota bacterium]